MQEPVRRRDYMDWNMAEEGEDSTRRYQSEPDSILSETKRHYI